MEFKTKYSVWWVFLLLGMGLPGNSLAQTAEKPRHLLLSVFNATPQLPGGPLFSTPIHPGLSAGMEMQYNRSEKNRWFQRFRLGYYHHRYVQNTIQLYTEFGYQRHIWKGASASFQIAGGYLHAIPDAEVFKLDGSQYKQPTNLGRPQAMAGAGLDLHYTLPNQLRLSLEYQFYLQMPFVKQYITLLPATLLHFGVAAPFSMFHSK